MLDLPPAQLPPEVTTCVATAAAHYRLDPNAALRRILGRRGKSGEVRIEAGRVELGLYGVPADKLASLGSAVTADQVRSDDCLNVSVGIYLDSSAMAAPANAPRAEATPSSGTGPGLAARSRLPALPKLNPEAESCVAPAAAAYRLPEDVFRAVLRTEGGWVGLKKRNPNGSYDLGPGQINTIHLPALAKQGITEEMLVSDPCINIHIAAYRLRVEIERAKDFWRGVGNYHSRTPHLHQAYLQRVRANL